MTTYGDMVFSAKLKTLMKQRRLSQTDIAMGADVSQSLVSLWTRGKSVPALDDAAKLARFLGVPLDFLGDDAQDEPPAPELSESEVAVIEFVRLMGLDKGEAIRRLATAPPVPVQRVDTGKDPEPLSDEQFARKYPPPGPYIPPGAPEWPPAKPRKKRPG